MRTPIWGREFLGPDDLARAERHHVPVVAHAAIRRPFHIVALFDESEPPTAGELWLLRRFTTFVVERVYSPGHAERILALPSPGDERHNTVTFFKHAGSWTYRRATWDRPWAHPVLAGGSGLSLTAAIDRLLARDSFLPLDDWHRVRDAA